MTSIFLNLRNHQLVIFSSVSSVYCFLCLFYYALFLYLFIWWIFMYQLVAFSIIHWIVTLLSLDDILMRPILSSSGTDISHWFEKVSRDVSVFITVINIYSQFCEGAFYRESSTQCGFSMFCPISFTSVIL